MSQATLVIFNPIEYGRFARNFGAQLVDTNLTVDSQRT